MLELNVEEITGLPVVKWNFETLRSELNNSLEKYRGMVFEEQDIIPAKDTRATLNKLSAAFNDKKKEVKAVYMSPYLEFEDKIKELMAMIDAPVQEIDSQIKKFEQKKKDEKLQKIIDIYDRVKSHGISLETIMKQEWLNSSYTIKKVEDDVVCAFNKINNEIKAIRSFESEFEVQLEDLYKKCFDLSRILNEKRRLESLKKEKEDAAKRAEELRKAKEQEELVIVTPVIQQTIEQEIKQQEVSEEEEVETLDFRVWVTATQKNALKRFLVDNKITFGKVS